jgi:hypothetical protein
MNQPAATPGATAGLQPFVGDGIVRYGFLGTSLSVDHQATKELRLSALGSYTIAGALDEEDRANYPLIRGKMVGLNGTYLLRLSGADSFVTAIGGQQAWSSNGSEATSLFGTEMWAHRFNAHASSSLSAGVSMTRMPFYQFSAISIYPIFGASLNYGTRLARGMLRFGVNAFSAPVLDPLRATVDPRIGGGVNAGWSRDRFSIGLNAGAALSVADSNNNAGAFNNFAAGASIGVRLTNWLSFVTGGSLAEQQYRGTTTVPFSYSAFAGLSFGVGVPLYGKKR